VVIFTLKSIKIVRTVKKNNERLFLIFCSLEHILGIKYSTGNAQALMFQVSPGQRRVPSTSRL